MRITKVEAIHVRVPLEKPYIFGRGTASAFDNVVVRVSTEEGLTGYGESVPLSVLGNAGTLTDLLNGPLAALAVGADPFEVESLMTRALAAAGGQADAISGLDLALWDLIGKRLGQPAYRLLGGALQTAILVDYTMGASTPEQMAQVARDIQAAGFRGVVVKIKGVVEDDVARVRAVRHALPSDHTVRVDCNAAYTRDQAFAFLKSAADIGGIEFVEQPVAGSDLEGMRLCRRYGVPISADESIASHEQALAAVVAEACDVMNIKVPTVGGLFFARQTAAIAAAAGLPVVVGGRLTLEITRAASRHFAAVTAGAVGRAHEGPGPASQALSDDVAQPRTTREIVAKHSGHVPVQTGPGLGIDVSWEKVEQYRVRA